METAGKDIDDVELREAMKDSGIGTPATRASIIERLISVDYIERDGRALHATEKGVQVIRLLDNHALTSAQLTGDWERRLGLIEEGKDDRAHFMKDIAKFATDTVAELDKLKGVQIERAQARALPACAAARSSRTARAYSCWSKDDPGCGYVIWKKKAGKNLPVSVAKELMEKGKTEKQVTGFRGRSGRTFRAKLKMVQNEEGKWRVDFDEEWADGKPPPPPEEAGAPDAAAAAAGEDAGNGAAAAPATESEAVEETDSVDDDTSGNGTAGVPAADVRPRSRSAKS